MRKRRRKRVRDCAREGYSKKEKEGEENPAL